MPRNSTGNYTLPAGNPVVPNTIIETTWANPTMSDIGAALTESLDRQGRGTMLAPLKIMDGTVISPSLAFNSNTNTGMYLAAANTIGFAVGGVLGLSLGATGVTIAQGLNVGGAVTFSGTLGIPAGTALLPGLFFTGDPDTGFYSPAADAIGISLGGVSRVLLGNNGMQVAAVASGVALDLVGRVAGNASVIRWLNNAGNTVLMQADYADASGGEIGTFVASSMKIISNGLERIVVGPTGAVTLNTPTSGQHTVGGVLNITGDVIAPNFYVGLTASAAGSFGLPALGANISTWGNSSAGSGRLDLNTNGQTRLRIDSSGEIGLNCAAVANVALRVQAPGFNDVGVEVIRFTSTTGLLQSYNRATAAYTSLLHIAADYSWGVSSSTPSMILSAAGNLGIGAPSSGERLTVLGATRLVGDAGLQATVGGGVVFTSLSATARMFIGDGTGYDWRIAKRAAGVTTDLATFSDSGNVGIGGAPSFALDILSPAAAIRIMPSSPANNALVRMTNNGGNAFMGLDNSSGGLGPAFALHLYHGGAFPIVFSTNGLERARIDATGLFSYGAREVGYRSLTRRSITGSFSFVQSDNGTGVDSGSVGAVATLPSTFTEGTLITLLNSAGGTMTIAAGAGMTLVLAGTSLTGTRTVAANGVATIWVLGNPGAQVAFITGAGVT